MIRFRVEMPNGDILWNGWFYENDLGYFLDVFADWKIIFSWDAIEECYVIKPTTNLKKFRKQMEREAYLNRVR